MEGLADLLFLSAHWKWSPDLVLFHAAKVGVGNLKASLR